MIKKVINLIVPVWYWINQTQATHCISTSATPNCTVTQQSETVGTCYWKKPASSTIQLNLQQGQNSGTLNEYIWNIKNGLNSTEGADIYETRSRLVYKDSGSANNPGPSGLFYCANQLAMGCISNSIISYRTQQVTSPFMYFCGVGTQGSGASHEENDCPGSMYHWECYCTEHASCQSQPSSATTVSTSTLPAGITLVDTGCGFACMQLKINTALPQAATSIQITLHAGTLQNPVQISVQVNQLCQPFTFAAVPNYQVTWWYKNQYGTAPMYRRKYKKTIQMFIPSVPCEHITYEFEKVAYYYIANTSWTTYTPLNLTTNLYPVSFEWYQSELTIFLTTAFDDRHSKIFIKARGPNGEQYSRRVTINRAKICSTIYVIASSITTPVLYSYILNERDPVTLQILLRKIAAQIWYPSCSGLRAMEGVLLSEKLIKQGGVYVATTDIDVVRVGWASRVYIHISTPGTYNYKVGSATPNTPDFYFTVHLLDCSIYPNAPNQILEYQAVVSTQMYTLPHPLSNIILKHGTCTPTYQIYKYNQGTSAYVLEANPTVAAIIGDSFQVKIDVGGLLYQFKIESTLNNIIVFQEVKVDVRCDHQVQPVGNVTYTLRQMSGTNYEQTLPIMRENYFTYNGLTCTQVLYEIFYVASSGEQLRPDLVQFRSSEIVIKTDKVPEPYLYVLRANDYWYAGTTIDATSDQYLMINICGSKTITVKSTQETVATNLGVSQWITDMTNWFASDTVGCEVTKYELYNKDGSVFNNEYINLQLGLLNIKAIYTVNSMYQLQVKALSFLGESATVDLTVFLCGLQQLSVMTLLDQNYSVVHLPGTDYLTVVQDVTQLFASSDKTCPIYDYKIHILKNGSYKQYTVPQIKLDGKALVISAAKNSHVSIQIEAVSRGDVYASQETSIQVCGHESIKLTSKIDYRLIFDSLNSSPGQVPEIDLSQFFVVSDANCGVSKYEFKVEDPKTKRLQPYIGPVFDVTGTLIKFSASLNSISNFDLTLSLVATTKGNISISKSISIQKCGSEKLEPASSQPLLLQFKVKSGKITEELSFKSMLNLFSLSDRYMCPIVKFKLVQDNRGSAFGQSNPILETIFVKDNQLVALNNLEQKTTIDVYLEAETLGQVKAYKQMTYQVEYVDPQLTPVQVKVQQQDVMGDSNYTFTHNSVVLSQFKGSSLNMSFNGQDQVPCQCVTLVQNQDNSFTIQVNKSRISARDFGVFKISVSLVEESSEDTLRRVKTFELSIDQGQAEQFDFWKRFNADKKTKKFKSVADTVTVWIDSIDSNGNIIIRFSQPLEVPVEVQRYLNLTQSRSLSKVKPQESPVDLNQVLEVKFLINSDEDEEKYQYKLLLTSWTQNEVKININFTIPLVISSGMQPDAIICKIIDSSFFLKSATGKNLELGKSEVQKNLPKQLPHGFKEEQVKYQAKFSKNTMQSLLIVQIIAQVLLNGAMDGLWSLYFSIQLLCYLKIYATPMPISAQIFNNEFIKMIEFEILNPEGVIKIFNSDFSMKQFLSGIYDQELNPNPSLFEDLLIYILIAVFALLVLIIMVLLKKKQTLREKLTKIIDNLKERMIWNGVIRSVLVGYVKFMAAISLQFILWQKHPDQLQLSDKVINIMFMLLVIIIVCIFYLILRANSKIANDRTSSSQKQMVAFNQKYSNLIDGIDVKNAGVNLYFMPIFLLRRVFFIFLASFMFTISTIQLQLLVFFNLLYLIFYVSHHCHKEPQRFRQEIINEILVMLGSYHVLLFTQFLWYNDFIKFILGYFFAGLVIFMCAFNIGIMIYKSTSAIIKRHQQGRILKDKLALKENEKKVWTFQLQNYLQQLIEKVRLQKKEILTKKKIIKKKKTKTMKKKKSKSKKKSQTKKKSKTMQKSQTMMNMVIKPKEKKTEEVLSALTILSNKQAATLKKTKGRRKKSKKNKSYTNVASNIFVNEQQLLTKEVIPLQFKKKRTQVIKIDQLSTSHKRVLSQYQKFAINSNL